MSPDADLDTIYATRFDHAAESRKLALWREIVHAIERLVPLGDAVLDVACDQGYFIRNVRAKERWATDVRDLSATFGGDIGFVRANGLELAAAMGERRFDTVFMSNYLEHLPSSDAVIEQLRQASLVLRPGGRVVILQPNIRFTGAAYWDFIDHRTPLTERSLAEACEAVGLVVERVIPRFLPYTTKSRYPQRPELVRLYLRLPILWRIAGQQTLLVARRPG